jgi:hypothetical protein
VPFTGPNVRDSFKQFFDEWTDFGLGKTGPNRPVNYHHELGHLRRDVGNFSLLEPRKLGLYGEVDLDESLESFPWIRAEVDKGLLGFSGETMPNWLEVDKVTGHVDRFWLVGAALTPKPSAPKGLTTVGALRAIGLEYDGDDSTQVETYVRSVWDFPVSQAAAENPKNGGGGVAYGSLPEANRQPQRSLNNNPALRANVYSEVGINSVSVPDIDQRNLRDQLMWYIMTKKNNPVSLMQEMPENFLRGLYAKFVKLLGDDELKAPQNAQFLRADIDAKGVSDADVFARVMGKQNFGYLRADELMQSDVAGFGDEWVYAAWEMLVYLDIRLASRVFGAIPSFNMPSNPYNHPRLSTGVTIRRVSEAANMTALNWGASSFPVTRIGTTNVTFNVVDKFGAAIMWTLELDRYSQVNKVEAYRARFVEDMAKAADRILLHGDETATTSNISHIGTDPTGTAYDSYLLVDGLRHHALVTATGQGSDRAGAGFLPQFLLSMRKRMGILGLDPRECVAFIDPTLYYNMLGAELVFSVEKYGDQAPIRTGELGSLDGVPLVVSEEMELVNASGQLEDSHDSTQSSCLMIRPGVMKIGKTFEQSMGTEFITAGPGSVMWAYMGFDWQIFQSTGLAYDYDIAP